MVSYAAIFGSSHDERAEKYFSSPHSTRQLALLADSRHQDTRSNNTLSELAHRFNLDLLGT